MHTDCRRRVGLLKLEAKFGAGIHPESEHGVERRIVVADNTDTYFTRLADLLADCIVNLNILYSTVVFFIGADEVVDEPHSEPVLVFLRILGTVLHSLYDSGFSKSREPCTESIDRLAEIPVEIEKREFPAEARAHCVYHCVAFAP